MRTLQANIPSSLLFFYMHSAVCCDENRIGGLFSHRRVAFLMDVIFIERYSMMNVPPPTSNFLRRTGVWLLE